MFDAIRAGEVNIVRALLDAKANINPKKYRQSPIQIALGSSLPMLKVLVSAKADLMWQHEEEVHHHANKYI